MMAYDNYFYATAFAIVILSFGGCSPERERVIVSGPVQVLANQRLSIKSPSLLHTPGYFNSVCLLPEQPTQLPNLPNVGFVSKSGNIFTPEVHVRNAENIEDNFRALGNLVAEDGRWLCFMPEGYKEQLHPPYTEVALLSTEPISIKSIMWKSVDKE